MFVIGDKAGQKVYPPGSGSSSMHGPSSAPPMPPTTIGMGMNMSQQQAMLAHQNSNMEMLERRREREREQQNRNRSGSTGGVSKRLPLNFEKTRYKRVFSVLPGLKMMILAVSHVWLWFLKYWSIVCLTRWYRANSDTNSSVHQIQTQSWFDEWSLSSSGLW